MSALLCFNNCHHFDNDPPLILTGVPSLPFSPASPLSPFWPSSPCNSRWHDITKENWQLYGVNSPSRKPRSLVASQRSVKFLLVSSDQPKVESLSKPGELCLSPLSSTKATERLRSTVYSLEASLKKICVLGNGFDTFNYILKFMAAQIKQLWIWKTYKQQVYNTVNNHKI